ncbi:glycosyltransferase [Virgibacillus proomii]|uniref:glycosyltransferase n=1 Tax=Virgibacillus proomii TaxID=84407 RepID=UPI001C121B99|nr:glycosyltransferase [Virgibacillus proomii]MBU5268067.1 glycosyltransferase [Virgibacillus proomii]
MHRKNIVFVLNEYNGLGGAQRVASILAKEFIKDKHNVAVLSINEKKGEISYFNFKIPVKVLHPNGYRAPMPIEIAPNLRSLKLRKVIKELKRRYLLKKKRLEVEKFFSTYGDEEVFVIVVQVYGMQWLEPLLYKKNIRIIGQSHESYKASKNSFRFKRILKYYRQIDKFLLLTSKDKQSFEMHDFTNTGVVYNPTAFRQKTDPRKRYKNKTIISTGRLVDNKGFDILIQAFSEISQQIPDWNLFIYGDGPEKANLQALIEALNLKNRVFLKGKVEDVKSVLTISSIFVLTSRAEGLPMSLIEAQSCGLPCISTDCAPGIREIIKEYKNGYVGPVDDIQVIARHMKRLILNENLFYSFSNNAYDHSAKFDLSNIRKQWYSIFEQLGGRKDESTTE